ncbi:hypothetical protein KP509_19G016700 [Ceratopteris richardii]|uniref:FAS1 domain-containing protein n=1 Tax=Ceratopteris richardii TaxID=49495 RepID=A0A8T2SJ18_CERRI|nr:hypothetical protein KP509_19G016700 [Ceratopteris richardii]
MFLFLSCSISCLFDAFFSSPQISEMAIQKKTMFALVLMTMCPLLTHSFSLPLSRNSTALFESLERVGFGNVVPSLSSMAENQTYSFMELVNRTGAGMEFTVFVPTDGNIVLNFPRTREMLEYHVSPQLIDYQGLMFYPTGYKIPTLLRGKHILVTSTMGFIDHQQRLTLDEIEVVVPDLYRNQFIVVHGLNGVLNPFIYGSHDT